jgi:hypothetical protein
MREFPATAAVAAAAGSRRRYADRRRRILNVAPIVVYEPVKDRQVMSSAAKSNVD